MRTVEEQLAVITAAAVTPEPVRIAISEALGLRCAERVEGTGNVPGFDQAAVDGYAVRSVDVRQAISVGDAPADSDLAVIITGDSSGDAETGNYGTQFLSDFAAGMDSTMGGVVLAGERGSADAEGAVGMIRADKDAKEDVSTVDNVGSVAGQVTVIRALQQQGEDRAGHYGTAPNAAAGTIE